MKPGNCKPGYKKAPRKRKVGVMLVSNQPQKFLDMQILKCNDPNESSICWYAIPTVTQLCEFKASKPIDPAIMVQFVNSEPPEDFRPIWSTYSWKTHFTARDSLMANGMDFFGVVCVGYKEEKSNGIVLYDAQIGLTGTVRDGESFWDAGVRETYEECNITIGPSQCVESFQEMKNGEIVKTIFVVNMF